MLGRPILASEIGVQIFYLIFLSFFIIQLPIKLFMTDFEWFTVSLKTPGPQVSAPNKAPPPGG